MYEHVDRIIAVLTLVAAIIAVYYAKAAPSKEDLGRVEEKLTLVTESIEAVRTHTAASEAHLAEQNRRDALSLHVGQVSVSVNADGQLGESLMFRFQLNNLEAKLEAFNLINEDDMNFGSFTCTATKLSYFEAEVAHDIINHWFTGCGDNSVRQRVKLHLFLRLSDQQAQKFLYADMSKDNRQVTPGVAKYAWFWSLRGSC